jgi:hypothetical protein
MNGLGIFDMALTLVTVALAILWGGVWWHCVILAVLVAVCSCVAYVRGRFEGDV